MNIKKENITIFGYLLQIFDSSLSPSWRSSSTSLLITKHRLLIFNRLVLISRLCHKRLHLWLPNFWWLLFRCRYILIIRINIIIDGLSRIDFLFRGLEWTVCLFLFRLFIDIFLIGITIDTDGLVIFIIELHIILAILIVLVIIEIVLIELLTISIRSY